MDLIDSLVANMTLAEKIGQLNMVTAGQAITGPISGGDLGRKSARGKHWLRASIFGAAKQHRPFRRLRWRKRD